MVSPKAENDEHGDSGSTNGGVTFDNVIAGERCQMDDITEARAPDIGDISINTSARDDRRKCFTNASSSSNSSNSGVDSYNADCSGGSDDQSSDDTSGKKKVKNAMLMNVSSILHKCNNGRHHGSTTGSCSSDSRSCEVASNVFSKKHDCGSPSAVSSPPKSGVSSHIDPADPRIDLSIVNSIPSSALLLPLHETARAALLQCNATPSTESDFQLNSILPSSMMSAEGYHHLLEAVRPYFQAQGILLPGQLYPSTFDNQHESAHNTVLTADSKRTESAMKNSSSEGFTSFFTTTDASKAAAKDCDSACVDQSSSDDNSSMAVLVCPKKRRNSSKQHQEEMPSSSSSDRQKKEKSHEHHRPVLSHMITDVSSSNPSNTTSGSGSGDNGANTTGSGSGTGSNHGSSGSGNENGKGSSEELAKEDSNSGDGTNNSEGSATLQDFKQRYQNRGCQANMAMPEEDTSRLTPENQQAYISSMEIEDKMNAASNTREQKLLDKKRKRIVMRREYEAQQQASTTSSEGIDPTEHFIQPGQPVTLDEVLVFSKIPRIVVQGVPPYLIVHKNAACCRVTGIDAHLVVGKPVSSLLSIPMSSIKDEVNFSKSAGGHKQNQEGAKTSVNLEEATAYKSNQKKNRNALNKLIATSGLGKMHCVLLQTRQQKHMVGQNVTIKHNKNYSKQQSEDSNDTSLTSNSERKMPFYIAEQDIPAINCQISVAPIVVSTANFEKHESTKRAKHGQHTQDLQDSYFETPEATHFVIQIAPLSSNSLAGSSNSVEQHTRSVDKISNHAENIDSSFSVQSSDLEAIVAIG